MSVEYQEYCEDEAFKATCNPGEVVVIEGALYGRMQVGRCVTRDYGHIGCAVDVTTQLDKWCSGKKECEVHVSELIKGTVKPCPKDFRSFLEASFKCVEGKYKHFNVHTFICFLFNKI